MLEEESKEDVKIYIKDHSQLTISGVFYEFPSIIEISLPFLGQIMFLDSHFLVYEMFMNQQQSSDGFSYSQCLLVLVLTELGAHSQIHCSITHFSSCIDELNCCKSCKFLITARVHIQRHRDDQHLVYFFLKNIHLRVAKIMNKQDRVAKIMNKKEVPHQRKECMENTSLRD